MKLNKLKRLLVVGVFFSMCISFNTAIAANEIDIPETDNDINTEYAADSGISPHADEIITKFRLYNNVLQYRRWNATKGFWVDPAWIDLE